MSKKGGAPAAAASVRRRLPILSLSFSHDSCRVRLSYRSSSVASLESPLRLPPRAAEMPPRAAPPPRPLRWKPIGKKMRTSEFESSRVFFFFFGLRLSFFLSFARSHSPSDARSVSLESFHSHISFSLSHLFLSLSFPALSFSASPPSLSVSSCVLPQVAAGPLCEERRSRRKEGERERNKKLERRISPPPPIDDTSMADDKPEQGGAAANGAANGSGGPQQQQPQQPPQGLTFDNVHRAR